MYQVNVQGMIVEEKKKPKRPVCSSHPEAKSIFSATGYYCPTCKKRVG